MGAAVQLGGDNVRKGLPTDVLCSGRQLLIDLVVKSASALASSIPRTYSGRSIESTQEVLGFTNYEDD